MAKELHNDVFDAALNQIAACTQAEVRTSASLVLVTNSNIGALDASNFTGPAEYGSGGRQLTCLVSSTSDMKAISVTSAGAAKRVALQYSSTSSLLDYCVAELTSAVSLGASDQVNLGSFVVALADPT